VTGFANACINIFTLTETKLAINFTITSIGVSTESNA
jgi:hypothetical protein